MNVAFTVATAGDMAGVLHFRVTANTDFDHKSAIDYIEEFPTVQQPIVMLIDDGASDAQIEVFAINAKQKLNALLVFVTTRAYVRKIWHAFDRVILQTFARAYNGLPVNELHVFVDPAIDDYPVVAPLGASQTHVYAMPTENSDYSKLINWARQSPYQIGIIRNPL